MPKKVSFRLTALGVKRHRKPGLLADGNGLYLQTSSTGAKSWLFRFRFAGRDRAHGLGSVDVVDLARARTEAVRCQQLLRDGIDPIEERRERRGALIARQATARTFKQVAEAFIETNEAGWRNAKHAAQWRSTLDTHAVPKIGAVPIGMLVTAHVLQVIEPIWTTIPETASRLRGRLEQVLDYAAARGLRSGENPARWKGHLDQVLPARGKVAPVVHHAAMPYAQLPAFYAELVDVTGTSALALRWLILTCGRTNEVIGATWGEIDLERGLWTVPATRMKAGREWRVPLSAQAVQLAQSIEHRAGVVFRGRKAREGLSDMALLAVMRRMKQSAVPHGFRSSFRDWCAETQHAAHEVVEMALAHAVGSKVEAAYRRSDLLEKRRALAQAWADFVAGNDN